MNESDVRNFLEAVKAGKISLDRAVHELRELPFEDLGFAKVDHHRSLRQGFPEVIFGRGKTTAQIVAIVRGMLGKKSSHNILVTRTDAKTYAAVKKRARSAKFHEACGAITIERSAENRGAGLILVVTAGTSDIPVAEERSSPLRSWEIARKRSTTSESPACIACSNIAPN